MTEPSIDFEFRSGAEISLGLPRYFADPEAEPLCMSFDMQDGLGGSLWTPVDPGDIATLLSHVAGGGKVRAWNCMFEWHIWNEFCVPLYGWPPLRLEQCIDSMAEAAAMNLPQGLGKCALALGLPADQQKDKRGKQLIQLLCVPQQPPDVEPREYYKSEGAYKGALTRHRHWQERGGRWINDPALFAELYDYCLQDTAVEIAVSRKLRPLSEYERKVWLQTQGINQRGVPIDVAECHALSDVVAAETERLNDEMRELTGGAVEAGTARDQLLAWLHGRGLHLDDVQSETIERALLLEGQDPDVTRALQIRAAVAQTSTAKLKAMTARVASDGTLKDMYVYHGCGPGRDASRGGVNVQNLASPSMTPAQIEEAFEILGGGDHSLAYMMYGDRVMDAAVSCVRGVIKAPPGKIFYDADYSSVENRFSAWIAGQDDKIELFRKGLDEYKTFAMEIFPVAYDEVTPKQRKFSKPGVLGGMFGQGAKGLVDYAAGMGVLLTLEESKRITDAYRAAYPKVQKLWYRCGDASIDAVRNPGVKMKCGEKLTLVAKNNFLFMQLPSSRVIAWAAPMVEVKETPWGAMKEVVTVMQVDAFTKQWRRDKLIGSSIFQSGVQGSARDMLIHGCGTVMDADYDVRMRTHDELTALVDIGFGSPDEMGRLMCIQPEWCSDLPLAFEAWAGERFRK